MQPHSAAETATGRTQAQTEMSRSHTVLPARRASQLATVNAQTKNPQTKHLGILLAGKLPTDLGVPTLRTESTLESKPWFSGLLVSMKHRTAPKEKCPICVYIYIYIYIERERDRDTCVCVYIYVYISLHVITYNYLSVCPCGDALGPIRSKRLTGPCKSQRKQTRRSPRPSVPSALAP